MENGPSQEIFELVHRLETRQRRRVWATFIGLLVAAGIAGAIARVSFFEAQKPLAGRGGLSEARDDGRAELEQSRQDMLHMQAESDRLRAELAHVKKEQLQAEAEREEVSRGGSRANLQPRPGSKQLAQMQQEITRLQQELATTRQQLTLAKQNVADPQIVKMQSRITQLERELSGAQENLEQARQNVAVLSEEADRYRNDALALETRVDEGRFHSTLNQALAYTYRKIPGDDKLAEAAYREALKIAETKNIRDPMIYNAFATFLQAQNRYDEAERLYKMALEVDPQYGKALNNLGTLYEATGDIQKALEQYEAAGEAGEKLGNENYLRLRSRVAQ